MAMINWAAADREAGARWWWCAGRRGACHAGWVTDARRARDVRVTLAGDALDDLRERLRRTRLPAADGDGWARGVPRSWLAARSRAGQR